MEWGRECLPDLIKDDRDRKEEARVEGQFEEGEKRLGEAEGNEVCPERGLMEVLKQILWKREEDSPDKNDGEDDLKEAFS